MKNRGKTEQAPQWYRDRPNDPTPIEKQFSDAAHELADAIEQEVWFGDKQKHSRYRVDFLLRDAQLIVELDGHANHSSKGDLAKDAVRQRYLTAAGYTVIRFTGTEIFHHVQECVDQVRDIYKDRIHRSPLKRRCMFVDHAFVEQEITEAMIFQSECNPEKKLNRPTPIATIEEGIDWLHERSFISVFVFHSSCRPDVKDELDGLAREAKKGEIRVSTISSDLYMTELCDQIEAYADLFDDFYVVADDRVYIPSMIKVFAGAKTGKFLRKGNEDSAYSGTELNQYRWQRMYYVVCASRGLELAEM